MKPEDLALFEAIASGPLSDVEARLRGGADPNARRDGDSWTPLFVAAKRGDLAIANALLAAGADPDHYLLWEEGGGYAFWTSALLPLDVAIEGGQEEVAALLVERCSNPWRYAGQRPKNPLEEAARRGLGAVVDRFIGRDGSDASKAADTALSAGRGALARRLILAGAVPSSTKLLQAAAAGVIDGPALLLDPALPAEGPWIECAVELGRADLIERLLERGAPATEYQAKRALEVAAAAGRAGAVRALLARKVDPSSVGAFDAAIEGRHVEVLRILVAASAARWLVQGKLREAAEAGSKEKVDALLAAGVDPSVPDWTGATPLAAAAEEGHADVIRRLVAAGTAPSAADEFGVPPLVGAARGGHLEAVRALLEAGARPAEADPYEASALLHAARGGHAEVARLLLSAGADPAAPDHTGATPLVRAARGGHAEVVRALLAAGADPKAADLGGLTAVDYARSGAHGEAAALLEAAGGRAAGGGGPPLEHRVFGPGNTLLGLAEETGLAPEAIWDHPWNARLRQVRAEMDALRAGDAVVLPARRASGGEGSKARPRVRAACRVRLLQGERPLGDRKFRVEVQAAAGGPPLVLEGFTDATGLLSVVVPATATELAIDINDGEYKMVSRLGGLAPPGSAEGLRQRLENLGFTCYGESGPKIGPGTEQALARFQFRVKLPMTGIPDAKTVARLAEVHDTGVFPPGTPDDDREIP